MPDLQLFLFTANPELAMSARRGGLDYIIVDLERGEKRARQAGTGFQVGEDTIQDVRRLAGSFGLPVVVRVNPINAGGAQDITEALDAGAAGLMLPMARNASQVREFLNLVPRDIRTLIQIETAELAAAPDQIRDLEWDYVHIGLNDLKLARGAASIWTSVLDGTVERVCTALEGRSFGFGGITVTDGGAPIPARLVMMEMVRLNCQVGVLRRSFSQDVTQRDPGSEISAIRELFRRGNLRDPGSEAAHRRELEAAIRAAGG